MLSSKEKERRISEVIENEYWADLYNNAPSENCREHIGHMFCLKLYSNPDEYKSIRNEIEAKLNKKDWEYLYAHSTNSPRRSFFKQKVEESEEFIQYAVDHLRGK